MLRIDFIRSALYADFSWEDVYTNSLITATSLRLQGSDKIHN